MSGDDEKPAYQHSLSPSAWNRFETCPRQYWLSRQRLPRKTGMAAALGTAVHASIEDLVAIDMNGYESTQSGWLPKIMATVLKERWEEEKGNFLATPRHPDWKEDKYSNAQTQQRGGVELLLRHAGAPGLSPNSVTAALWKRVQALVIACEGELRTKDGRIMGRLDLLLADVDEENNIIGWRVADLKTGRVPEGELYDTVRRQLLLYRDILLANNPDAPPTVAVGWYTNGSKAIEAHGDPVIDQAYLAWEATQIDETPLEPTPGDDSCGGFCDWKAWCPHWWNWRNESGKLHRGDFVDAVVLIHSYEESGAAVIELCVPADSHGRPMPTGHQTAAVFAGNSKKAMDKLTEDGYQGALFIGGAMAKGNTWRIGGWCDVLPWTPIPDTGRTDQ
jgi:CRISPR/Cas system-associated exonuclease Cas4 (RecB family)